MSEKDVEAAERVSALLVDLHFAARRIYTEDLSHRAIRILQIVSRAESPPRMQDIAAELASPASSTSELVKRLQKRGLVERRRSEKDERVVEVEITAEGLAALREHSTPDEGKFADALAELEPAERREFENMLNRMIEGAKAS